MNWICVQDRPLRPFNGSKVSRASAPFHHNDPKHTHIPRRPKAQTMLSPPRQEKIIKQRTVNSFPACLGPLRGCSPTPTNNPSKLQSSLQPEDRTESTLGGGRERAVCWPSNPHVLITQGQAEQAPFSVGETEAWDWLKVIQETIGSCF